MAPRILAAGYGVLATLLGVASGHLIAALTVPAASPVLAVGSTVIDLTPTPVKEWAVARFGTADKPILIGSVVVVVLVLAAVFGIVAITRRRLGVALLVALALIAAVLAAARPSSGLLDPVPGVVAAVVGGIALWWLHSLHEDTSAPDGTGPSRRTVLVAGGATAGLALLLGGAGRWLSAYRLGDTDIRLPTPTDAPAPLPAGLDQQVSGITPWRTPASDFYRIDTRLSLPVVDAGTWTLTVDGDVEREVTLTLDDLFGMEVVERDITLTCVSNQVGGPYVGGARWRGVRLTDVLDRAGIADTGADQILCTDVDGMTISTPLSEATDGRDALIAFGMNGEALPRAHGFPVRMVVPGLYGFVSACKWLTRMTLTTYDAQQAYWTERDWATHAPIKLSSRIDTPKPFSDQQPGRVVIGGIAWAQGSGVESVEVRVDGGPWRAATLGPSAGTDYWRQWYFEWDAEPGRHFIACRATNRDGDVQTAVRTAPFPNGSSGIQEISVNVGT